MLPIEIPEGTTIESLVTEVMPALHARTVAPAPAGAPAEAFVVAVRIEGAGDWTVRIQGNAMTVEEGIEEGAGGSGGKGAARGPTLWMHTTDRAVERFLEDATGPRRLMPTFEPAGGVATMSDPRVVKRLAMASGSIELAVEDEDGTRLAVAFGFGPAARRPIDPVGADVVVETHVATLERVLRGELGPEEALADGDVKVRGKRFLALQLALAVAPFYPARR